MLRGEMLIYDALYGETRKIGLQRRARLPDLWRQRRQR